MFKQRKCEVSFKQLKFYLFIHFNRAFEDEIKIELKKCNESERQDQPLEQPAEQ